ncbi:serine hydrolase domain-containing protein [Ktedonobacter racemifer]|uniref:Beta-lactamase n=1 Tax=Ktedonobacter racemifer DSM 44963 TaxID=485913 RepID=D6TIG0_KTERA|nr:serine hydrolase domain-containing protein [Ktedonobacter racemifer]EFH89217.1 beta-lactamase [Ktedonobacter racemifer DSM 44963]
MSHITLTDFVETTFKTFNIPGVAVGVWLDGKEIYACYGVTSVDNPLPIDQNTLFALGSITKSFTATTLMRLVAEGKVELNAPVRRYIPELQLKDTQAADKVTVLNLLNHTSGLDWRVNADTGEGDDALERYVAKMAEVDLIAPLGSRVSYSQAGYNLLGRIIEKVTGQTFDRAVASLVFEPLGLSHSFFARDDIMTRRFAVGHDRSQDGTLSIARPWRHSRGDNPGGGIASSTADLLRWGRFHLGDGHAESGIRVLPTHVLHQMKDSTAELRASTLGDAIGLCWFLRDVDGVRTAGHGGSANGQFSELLIVPERNFAVISLTNAGPDGIPFNQEVVRWALENYLGIIDRDPEPISFDAARAQEIVGNYENEMMTFTIDTVGAGLRLEVLIKPEIRAAADQELPQDYAPFAFGLLPGDKDEYIITDGALKGQRGFFTRGTSGVVVGVDLAGRLFSRVQ